MENKSKELLQIEFRYYDKPISEDYSGCKTKTITIGVFDTLEQAVNEGNKAIEALSKSFEVRPTDRFKIKGLFGLPDRLVTNSCYPTKGIQYFAKITKIEFTPIEEALTEIFEASNRYNKYKAT